MLTQDEKLTELEAKLDDQIPDRLWLGILETFLASGVADNLQLTLKTGLERNKLRRILERMQSLGSGLPAIFRQLDHDLPRPDLRGRRPAVYLLGETGADLLRKHGHNNVNPCGLKEDIPLMHAQAICTIHIAALNTGLAICTDEPILFGDSHLLRPDHRIFHSNGMQIIYEIEQIANSKLTPRISESLQNKLAFFASQEGENFLHEIRMILNLKRGGDYYRTLQVWQKVLRLLSEKTGSHLDIKLLAIPITEFLNQPDWDIELHGRWDEISTGATFQSEESERDLNLDPSVISLQHNTEDDITLLTALYQEYKAIRNAEHIQPDYDFLMLALLIYNASHQEDIENRMMPPYASIYLLREYLKMHPDLQTRIQKAMHYGQGRVRWSPPTILHRMQVVCQGVLAYFNWGGSDHLLVHATSDWKGPGQFGIKVEIFALDLANIGCRASEVAHAVAWVLWALFEYSEALGLGRPEFW